MFPVTKLKKDWLGKCVFFPLYGGYLACPCAHRWALLAQNKEHTLRVKPYPLRRLISLRKIIHLKLPFFKVNVTTKFRDSMILKKIIIHWIFRWYLNRYYSMILIQCYYLVSTCLFKKILVGLRFTKLYYRNFIF